MLFPQVRRLGAGRGKKGDQPGAARASPAPGPAAPRGRLRWGTAGLGGRQVPRRGRARSAGEREPGPSPSQGTYREQYRLRADGRPTEPRPCGESPRRCVTAPRRAAAPAAGRVLQPPQGGMLPAPNPALHRWSRSRPESLKQIKTVRTCDSDEKGPRSLGMAAPIALRCGTPREGRYRYRAEPALLSAVRAAAASAPLRGSRAELGAGAGGPKSGTAVVNTCICKTGYDESCFGTRCCPVGAF